MKKVIDVSAFNSPELERFLGASPNNRAVLTDFAGVETFKREGLANVQRAFAGFLPYADQVLVLKPTRVISLMRPRSKGLQARLVDEESSAGFADFVRTLNRAHQPQARAILQQFERKHLKAAAMVDQFTRDAQMLKSDFGVFAIGRAYPQEILTAIRSGAPLPEEFGEGVVTHILQLAGAIMGHLFPAGKPRLRDAVYSFPFRYIVAMYCMNLFWTAKGDVTTAPLEKVRNDATDMTYVAHATFFDGIITYDNKLAAAYDLTRGLLNALFKV